MRKHVVVWVALVGCGNVDDQAKHDAPIHVDMSFGFEGFDGPTPARCNPTAPFATPVALSTLNTADSDEAAGLSPDELTIYFSSSRPGGAGGFDLYQASRTSLASPFSGVAPVTGVNTTADERGPRISADGLTLVASQIVSGGKFHVVISQRSSTTVAFPALQPISNVNGTSNDADIYLLPSGNVIYFGSDRGGSYDLYRSSRTSGAFMAPTLVSGVQLMTSASEDGPVITPDELDLYFASDRAGGLGSLDIYQAHRASLADGFGAPIPLTSLNSANTDAPAWISADNCDFYFTRYEPPNGYEMYVAKRGL